MANNSNLIPVKAGEEARTRGRNGGIKSGIAKRARKDLKNELLLLLSSGNTQEKISLALIQEALNGNVKAFECIRDTIGEKPRENQDIEMKASIKIDYGD